MAFYITHTVIMTLALFIATRKADPWVYDEGIDIFRGICEVALALFLLCDVFVQLSQMKRYKHTSHNCICLM